MKILVDEIRSEGLIINWLVAVALNRKPQITNGQAVCLSHNSATFIPIPEYSMDFGLSMPLFVIPNNIALEPECHSKRELPPRANLWCASINHVDGEQFASKYLLSPLLAACIVFVRSKVGAEYEIPDDLSSMVGGDVMPNTPCGNQLQMNANDIDTDDIELLKKLHSRRPKGFGITAIQTINGWGCNRAMQKVEDLLFSGVIVQDEHIKWNYHISSHGRHLVSG